MASVLLLNLGGPATLGEVRPFLTRLFSDPMIIALPGGGWFRGLFARALATTRAPRVRGYYRQIGGGSPLLRLTQEQARSLAAELARRGRDEVTVDVVMRYTEPGAATALSRLAAAGERLAIALPLYPHECGATTGSSLADLDEARRRVAPGLRIVAVREYHLHPGYIESIASRIRETLDRLPAPDRDRAVLLFSAHGVPESLPRRGDPYVRQIRETVAAVLARLGTSIEHRLGFQSRTGPVRWVGPGTDEVIAKLAGRPAVIVVPVAFVSDHIETLYEIDILFATMARKARIGRFVRIESLNSSPVFVNALADLVEDRLDGVQR